MALFIAGEAEAAELALRERAEHDDVLRVSCRNRGIGDLNRHRRDVAAAGPGHGAERQLPGPQGGHQPQGVVPIHRIGDEAINVTELQTGIRNRVPDRDARELELRLRRTAGPVVRRLAHTTDHAGPVHRSLLSALHRTRLDLGSKNVRSESPSMFDARTVRLMATPGTIAIQGARTIYDRPSPESMLPHDG